MVKGGGCGLYCCGDNNNEISAMGNPLGVVTTLSQEKDKRREIHGRPFTVVDQRERE